MTPVFKASIDASVSTKAPRPKLMMDAVSFILARVVALIRWVVSAVTRVDRVM